ncbi:MAG: hypothetical protein AAGB51_08415 [Planctomycetota bacterium]
MTKRSVKHKQGPYAINLAVFALAWCLVLHIGHVILAILVEWIIADRKRRAEAARLKRELAADRRGRCLHCNYDLSGLSEGTCPECGHSFSTGMTNQVGPSD